jgi:hypothetical protein
MLPTLDRPRMAHRATHYFLEQDYAGPAELHVWDDGEATRQTCDRCADDPRVVYRRIARTSLPAKRNGMMREIGDRDAVYVLWDDDDYHGPTRIRRQVAALLTSDRGACLMHPTLYYVRAQREVALSVGLVADAACAYRWSFWETRNWYESIDPGSGAHWIMERGHQIVRVAAGLDYIVVRHEGEAGVGRHRHLQAPALRPPGFLPVDVPATQIEMLLHDA